LGILRVVIKENAQVLVTDVDVRIPAKPPVLFLCLTAPAEPMTVNLILDLVGRVVHVYARIDVGCAHLCLWTLQSREEFCVQQSRLGVPQLVGDVARKAEVGILVDSTWDKARNVGLCAENLWERVGKGRCCLNRAEVYLANVITETKGEREAEEKMSLHREE